MNAARARSIALAAMTAVGLGGCFSAPRRSAPPPTVPQTTVNAPPRIAPQAQTSPPPPETVPDAIPRFEPRSLYGNPPFYDVFGKRYYVLSSSVDYVERGVASWYGPGFHKVRTSTGEPYDMYGMTAAHKTLPLPAYVRVTNLENGRSVVLRVNDRGPFVGNRIIDLSYTAAAKLDMLRNGTAMVEVRALQPVDPAGDVNVAVARDAPTSAPGARTGGTAVSSAALADTPLTAAAVTAAPLTAAPLTATSTSAGALAGGAVSAAPPPAAQPVGAPASAAANLPAIAPAPVTSAPVRTLFVQAGAFANPANAERLAAKLRGGGYGTVFVREDVIGGRRLYRVRIGPVPDVPEFDRIVAALEQVGVRDAHLALD